MVIYPSGVTTRDLVSALSIKALFHSWAKHVPGSATFLRNVATVSRLVAVMRFTPSGDCTRMICGEKRTAPVSCGDTEPTTPAQLIPPAPVFNAAPRQSTTTPGSNSLLRGITRPRINYPNGRGPARSWQGKQNAKTAFCFVTALPSDAEPNF